MCAVRYGLSWSFFSAYKSMDGQIQLNGGIIDAVAATEVAFTPYIQSVE